MTDSMRLSGMTEVAVAHRSIGQERLGFASESRSGSSLDGLFEMLDWTEIADLLGGIHANAKGERPGRRLPCSRPCYWRSGMTCRT